MRDSANAPGAGAEGGSHDEGSRLTITIDNIELTLAHPDDDATEWIGGERLREQLVAAWLIAGPGDVPLNPRLVGKPGIGKTTLAFTVARSLGREVYIHQCTMDTRPEDLLITPVISRDNKIAYHASPLVTAMIRGGCCILDEGNRMSEKSWASLAPLLDHRRYIESIVTGLKIKAHPDFRVCCTMNDDASTYEIPEYIQSRLQPQIEIGYPDRNSETRILKYNVPFAPDDLIEMAVDYLQRAHRHYLPFTSRDGVNLLRYCVKLGKMREADPRTFFDAAVEGVLGQDGVDFLHGAIPSNARYHQASEEFDPDEEVDDEDQF